MLSQERYPSVAALLSTLNPADPVYCIYPHVYRETARQFIDNYPGRVLYAVKACSEPAILKIFVEEGLQHFDCASLTEIEIVNSVYPDGTCYFMVPVRLRGEAERAQKEFGTRHFLLDHLSGVAPLAKEIDMQKSVVFARMAVSHDAAIWDLSSKFGAPPAEIPDILNAIADTGAEPALAFNVGSSVTHPDAYRASMKLAAEVIDSVDLDIRLVDVGGGYPRSYPGFPMPDLSEFFAGIRESAAALPLVEGGEILGEPGRALACPGMSAVSEVLQRKGDKLYLNDGMHGIFWELRFKSGHDQFPARCYRNGELMDGTTMPFTLYGPTCDSDDVLPAPVDLPADMRPGDHIEFGRLGAYSLSGRTDFNGRYSSHIVMIDGTDEHPPGHFEYKN